MTLLAAFVSLALTASEPPANAVVLVSRRTAVSAPEALALAASCSTHLRAVGVPMALEPDAALKQLTRVSVKDTTSCNGRKPCLAELGRQLKVDFVVLLSAATLDKETSVGLELLRVSDETVVEKDSLMLAKKAKLDADALSGFAAKVKAVLVPEPPKPVVAEVTAKPDAPKETPLVPKPKEDETPKPLPVEQAPSHATSFVLGGVGAAALIAGGVLLAVGMGSRAPLTQGETGADGRVRSTLTGAEAQALNASSSLVMGGGAGAAVIGLGLGGAAFFTW